MGRFLILSVFACVFFCACASDVSNTPPRTPANRESEAEFRDRFFSDSLNVCWKSRTYPAPDESYTPAPRGYKPVYISSYARHGSRKMVGRKQIGVPLEVLEEAAKMNCLTSLGEEVYAKLSAMDEDLQLSDGDLTSVGVEQHRGIADRMYRNYKNVFSHKNTPVRLYSTMSQRSMMSMLSENVRLLELNPNIVSTCEASKGLNYLKRVPEFPAERSRRTFVSDYLDEYFDARPLLSRLFTSEMPPLRDTASFVHNLYLCAIITCGLDVRDWDFIWDVFTYGELYTIFQASNYNWYVLHSNSSYLGDYVVPGMSPLLRDFIDRADTALAEDVPGADLRFGHDSYLTSFCTLIGLNGFVPREDDPLKVIEIFNSLDIAPMACNVQMVFYRNRSGDVIVKLLQNEIEAFVPIDTDIWPYYHWDDLRAYLESRIHPDFLEQDSSLVVW